MLSFRLRAWAVRILFDLSAMLLDTLLNDVVGNCKHAVYKVRELVVFGGMFHANSLYHDFGFALFFDRCTAANLRLRRSVNWPPFAARSASTPSFLSCS